MLALCAADHELATKEFFVVQFLDRSFGFVDRLHLHEGESFGALIVAIAHHLGILDVTDAVEQVEEVALRGVERQVADVEPWRCHFDRLRFAHRP